MAMQDRGVVSECQAIDCSYNSGSKCWAPGVMVGQDHNECDTYTHEAVERQMDEGRVVGCDAATCDFNLAHECSASHIELDTHQDHADCRTFMHM